MDCIKRVVSLLLDTPIYIQVLFEMAEDLFQKEYLDAADCLYDRKIGSPEISSSCNASAGATYLLF